MSMLYVCGRLSWSNTVSHWYIPDGGVSKPWSYWSWIYINLYLASNRSGCGFVSTLWPVGGVWFYAVTPVFPTKETYDDWHIIQTTEANLVETRFTTTQSISMMTFVLTLDAILLKYWRTLLSWTILVKGVSTMLTVALKWCIKRCFHRFSFKKLK